jgi:hypothetical protein
MSEATRKLRQAATSLMQFNSNFSQFASKR